MEVLKRSLGKQMGGYEQRSPGSW